MHFTLLRHASICVALSTYGLLWSKGVSLKGIVINHTEKTPIHGASIYIEDVGIGTTSQVDGQFFLEGIPNYDISLTISMIGFRELKRSLKLKKGVNDLGQILMAVDTIKIEEILVDPHAELTPKDFQSNISVSGNQYHTNLKSSLALTLQEETGLSIRSMGQGVTQPVLRGYTGDRFMITEDGITTGDLANTSIDHTISMDMAAFNKVNIIRGPEALLYGSNTIGGVIDVSRQVDTEARFKKSSLHAILGAESSNSSYFGNVVYYQPVNYNHQLKLSILGRDAGNQRSPGKVLDNTALSNIEMTGSYSYYGKDFHSTVSYEDIDMNYGIPGSPEGHISGVDIDLYKKTQKFNAHKDISLIGFQTIDIDQRYIRYGHTESEKDISNPAVILTQQLFSFQTRMKGPGIHIGSLYQSRKFQAGGFYWTPNTQEISMAVFGLIEKDLNKFTLQLSARGEYVSVRPNFRYKSTNIDPSEIVQRDFPIFSAGAAIYQNWGNWELSLGTMFTGRAPGIEDLFSDGPHLGTYAYEIGEPTLNSEQTFGLEASIKYETEKSLLKVTSFQNFSPNYHISSKLGNCTEEYVEGKGHPCAGADYIEWGSGSTGWLYKYQMLGKETLIYGFESELKYKLTNVINLYGSASIIRGENISDNTPLSYMPPDKFLFSTELDLYPLSASIIFRKISPQTLLGEFETKTDGYLISNLRGSYILPFSNGIHKIIFCLDNIFNEVYYDHLSRIKLITPENARSLGLQYRVTF